MRLSKSSIKDFTVSILLIIQYSLLLSYLLSLNSFNTFLYISIVISILSIIVVIFIGERKLLFFALVLFFVLLFAFTSNFFLVGNITEKLIVRSLIVNFSIALLLNTKALLHKTGIIIYLLFLIAVIILYLKNGDVQEIFPHQSKNYLTFYALVFSFPYLTKFIKLNQKPPIFYVVTLILLGVISYSRAGIIMSLVFFVGWFFVDINKNWKTLIKNIFYLSVLSFIAFHLLQYIDSFTYIVNRFIQEGVQDNYRILGWREYIHELIKLNNIIFGVPINDLPFVSSRLAGSLHSSFLQAHATGGLIYFLFNIIVLSLMIILYIKKRNYIGFLIIFVFILRNFVDTNYPGAGLGDIILYYYFFNYVLKEKKFRLLRGM